MNILPDDIVYQIYKMKHEMEFNNVLFEIKKHCEVYNDCDNEKINGYWDILEFTKNNYSYEIYTNRMDYYDLDMNYWGSYEGLMNYDGDSDYDSDSDNGYDSDF